MDSAGRPPTAGTTETDSTATTPTASPPPTSPTTRAPSIGSPYGAHTLHASAPAAPPSPPPQPTLTTHLSDIYIGDYSDSENESTKTTSTTTSSRHHHAPSAPQPPTETLAATATDKDPDSNALALDQSSSLPYAPQHLRQLEEEKYRVQQHEEKLERQHLEEQQQQQQRLLRGRHPADDDQVYEMCSLSPVPAYQSAIFEDGAVYMDHSGVAKGAIPPSPRQALSLSQRQPIPQAHGQTLGTRDPFTNPPVTTTAVLPSEQTPSGLNESSPPLGGSHATAEIGTPRRFGRRERPRSPDGRPFGGATETTNRERGTATTGVSSSAATTALAPEQYRDGRATTSTTSSNSSLADTPKPLSLVDRFRLLAGYGPRRRYRHHPQEPSPQAPLPTHLYPPQSRYSSSRRVVGTTGAPAHRLSSRSDLMESQFSVRQSPSRYPQSHRSGASPRVSESMHEWRGRAVGSEVEMGRPMAIHVAGLNSKVVVRKTGVPGKNGQEPETDLFNFIDIMLDMPERPEWHEVMKTLAKVLVVMAVSYFALMALYFAAEFQADQSLDNINVVVVDLDYSMVGSEFISYTNSVNNNPRKINWTVETAKYKTQQQVMDDVDQGKYWGAVVIQPNSSRSLFSALSVPNKDYDPTRAFTMIYDGGRNPLVTKPVVVSGMYMHFVEFLKTFNSKWIFTVLSLAEDGNQTLTTLIDTPWVLGTPVAFHEIDLHPPTAHILSSATTVAYIWVFLVAGGSTYLVANAVQPMTRHASVARTMWYMVAPMAVFLTVLSMVYSLLLLTFGVPFDSLSQFFALFGIPVVYIPSITITYVIMNVIAVFNTVELMPTFYRWAHAMPFLNAVQMARYVLLGSYNRLAANVPILFAWIVLPIMLLPFAIARQKRLMSEVEQRELLRERDGMESRSMQQRIPRDSVVDDEKRWSGSEFSSRQSSRRGGGRGRDVRRRRRRGHQRGGRGGDEDHPSDVDDQDSYLSDEDLSDGDGDLAYETTSEHRDGSHDEDEEAYEHASDGYEYDTLSGRRRRRSRFIRRSRVAPEVPAAVGRNIQNPFVTPAHPSGSSLGSTMAAVTPEHLTVAAASTSSAISVPRGPAAYVAPMPPKTFVSASASAPPMDSAANSVGVVMPMHAVFSSSSRNVPPTSSTSLAGAQSGSGSRSQRNSQGSNSGGNPQNSDNSSQQQQQEVEQPTSTTDDASTDANGASGVVATGVAASVGKARHIPTHRPTPSTSSTLSMASRAPLPANTTFVTTRTPGTNNSSNSGSGSNSNSNSSSPYTQPQRLAHELGTPTQSPPLPLGVSVPMPVLKRQPYASELTADLQEIK
ncbi:hypothetical protein BGZ73_001629 [Actinomortierella ambigua]|nr:hypothetical protein BGZ73_001629 [Actinomortierella ambigua]